MGLTELIDKELSVWVFYKNYRGEERLRSIIPIQLWFGTAPWYNEPQWLLKVYDNEKKEERTFAMANILRWHGNKED